MAGAAPRVFFVEPADGATVKSPVHLKFGSEKTRKRIKRKGTIRKRITGTAERPRLSVFRSAKHVYAQAIDDTTGRVLAAARTRPVVSSIACA